MSLSFKVVLMKLGTYVLPAINAYSEKVQRKRIGMLCRTAAIQPIGDFCCFVIIFTVN